MLISIGSELISLINIWFVRVTPDTYTLNMDMGCGGRFKTFSTTTHRIFRVDEIMNIDELEDRCIEMYYMADMEDDILEWLGSF